MPTAFGDQPHHWPAHTYPHEHGLEAFFGAVFERRR